MLSLIDVKCPHCNAQGQIVQPPMGAIILGPCPECQGMVAIFCGVALPLDRDIMMHGKPDEKRDHLMEALNTFLRDRVERIFGEQGEQEESNPLEMPKEKEEKSMLSATPLLDSPSVKPITQTELESFSKVDLRLIDNKEYFKAVFG
jgi:hypothetical protein